MPSAAPTITVGMIARPSRPSVRLTALLVPTITQERQRDEAPHAERIADGLEERHDQVGLRRQRRLEAALHPRDEQLHEAARCRAPRPRTRGRRRRRAPITDCHDELRARRQALRIAVDDLAVVVDPADRAEAQRHQQHDPDEAVVEVAPQQRRDRDRHQDQRAAHRRRAGLDEMRLRTVVAHRLADLHPRQPRDHARPDDERDDQRGHASPAPRAA